MKYGKATQFGLPYIKTHMLHSGKATHTLPDPLSFLQPIFNSLSADGSMLTPKP